MEGMIITESDKRYFRTIEDHYLAYVRKRGNRKTMKIDFEPLLEMRRKTKAGEVAPLVDVPIKHFWFWPGRAYWAYVSREKIAIRQLELRKEKNLASDERVKGVALLLKQIYDEASWSERGEMFTHLMAEDSWPMVAALVDQDVVDDLGLVHFLQLIDQQYGKLTSEETEMVSGFKTVGELSAFLERVRGEGREKGMVCFPGRRHLIGLLFLILIILFVCGIALLKGCANYCPQGGCAAVTQITEGYEPTKLKESVDTTRLRLEK